jgi:hypothetical protein
MALCVDGAIDVGPFPFNCDVRPIDPPASSHRPLVAAKLFFNLRRICDDPAIESGMIHHDSSLAHLLLQLPVRDGIGHIPSDALQDDFLLNVTALEVHTPTSSPQLSGRDKSLTLLK